MNDITPEMHATAVISNSAAQQATDHLVAHAAEFLEEFGDVIAPAMFAGFLLAERPYTDQELTAFVTWLAIEAAKGLQTYGGTE